ncbi:hypothetical protein BN1723_001684, partial [Verticillium longisporum]
MATITKQAEGESHGAQPTAAITQISAKYIRAESPSWTVKGQAGSNTTEHHTVTPPRTIAVPLEPKKTGASVEGAGGWAPEHLDTPSCLDI